MQIEDLPGVLALGERLFTPDRWPTLYRTWDEDTVLGHYQSGPEYCFVAIRKRSVVGFLLGAIIRKRRPVRTYAYLVWIGVSLDCAGRGLGHQLYDRFEEQARHDGASLLLVDTEADNRAALTFFDHLGFRKPEPHVYLAKPLQDSEGEQKKSAGAQRCRIRKSEASKSRT